jgi:ectoine hydroxylase-related dioxygenase (phytanoyl-CoA dioxygenase family)
MMCGMARPSGPLSHAERWFFDVHGYVVRRGALASKEVQRLNRAVDDLRLPEPGADIGSQRFRDHLHRDAAFRDLLDHPAVMEVVRELCGPHVRLDHAYGLVMAPGTSGLSLHGGAVPFDPAQYYVAGPDGIHCGLVAVQWALVDHRPGEGGFACVPGTHKAAFAAPWGQPLDALQREVPMAAGDMVVFTEALVHGTLPWRGSAQRRALFYKYSPGSSAWDLPADIRPELLQACTPRQRALLAPASVWSHPPVP